MTFNVTKKDMLAAVEVAQNSNPCIGALKEVSNTGKPGAKNAYCIMGCVIQGMANNRHKSFDTIKDAVSYYVLHDKILIAVGEKKNQYGEFKRDLIGTNDGFTNKGALKTWQVKTLKSLAAKM